MGAASAVARRAFADGRTRTLSFAALIAFLGYASPAGYRQAYPTVADRAAFARSFGTNKAVELFYGTPHDLLSVGGFTGWRVGGTVAIFAAVWGLLAAVRFARTEEDAGRQELVLGAGTGRRAVYFASVAATLAGLAVLAAALVLVSAAARLPLGASVFLAAASLSPALVFVGAGCCVSQLAAGRRVALELGTVLVLAAYLLRVVGDVAGGARFALWLTPLGWAEQMRPFAQPRPWLLVLPLATGAVLIAVAAEASARRDVGRGLVEGRDESPPRLALLGSPTALAARSGLGTFGAWLGGTSLLALVIGLLSTAFTPENIPAQLRRDLRKLGSASLTSPGGALGFYFLFFVLGVSLFGCAQIAAARRDEADGQLELLLALPVGRMRWLGARLVLITCSTAALALAAGLFAWVGAASRGAGVALPRLLEAGANCIPAGLLFVAAGALAFAAVPRAAPAVAYAFVLASFVWELVADLLGVPSSLVGLSPFAHVGLVPGAPFRAGAAAAMLGLAAAAAGAAIAVFARRDLQGA
ncbi:MAG TPA: hypothetical protein VFB25_03075 [Gaiellaceae bacterium]|nr:hypothetical protein [Gaiellaceae bacterium]